MMQREKQQSLAGVLEEAFARFRDRAALEFGKVTYTYAQLEERSASIAAWLASNRRDEGLIGVFATKEFQTYAAIIGIVRAGKAYVPLNPAFPIEKNIDIARHAGLRTIFGNTRSQACAALMRRFEGAPTAFVDADAVVAGSLETPTDISPENPLYVLYTSGSTGLPKGVLIRHGYVLNYLDNATGLIEIDEKAKCSQTFALNFDLSVHDIFFTLIHGASLCVPEANELLSPASYIRKRGITHWFSVPSLAAMMGKLRQFKERDFPSLRYVLFCGEALKIETVKDFRQAAPQAKFINLYGPTEATIATSAFVIEDAEIDRYEQVPIGRIFSGVDAVIEDLSDAGASQRGELLLKGKQVIQRYYNNAVADAACFKTDANGDVWYRTGDIVERDQAGSLLFAGRKDTQVKINGFRVELGEIERAVTTAVKGAGVVCLYLEDKVVVVLEGPKTIENAAVLEACRATLPSYMIPQRIVQLASFPLNANGKIDRKEILRMVNQNGL